MTDNVVAISNRTQPPDKSELNKLRRELVIAMCSGGLPYLGRNEYETASRTIALADEIAKGLLEVEK